MIDPEDLLARLVLPSLPLDKFEVAYEEDVGDPSEEVCQRVSSCVLPRKGVCQLYLLRGGLTVVEDEKGRWSCYESRSRVEEREYFAAWAAFARGSWTSRTPTQPGVYPTRDLEGRRGRDRELRIVNGRLKDVTPAGGFQGGGRVSEWRGMWWSLKFPPLKGAM